MVTLLFRHALMSPAAILIGARAAMKMLEALHWPLQSPKIPCDDVQVDKSRCSLFQDPFPCLKDGVALVLFVPGLTEWRPRQGDIISWTVTSLPDPGKKQRHFFGLLSIF